MIINNYQILQKMLISVANIIWQHSRASLYKNWCSFKMDVPWEHLSMIQKTREGTHKCASNINKQDISPMNMDINRIWASIISLSIYPCLAWTLVIGPMDPNTKLRLATSVKKQLKRLDIWIHRIHRV